MTNSDFIQVSGPASLAELVAVVDISAPKPSGELAIVPLGGDEYATIQYDEVDKDSWPYLVVVDSRSEDEGPVRAKATAIMKRIRQTGWAFRMTSDADDSLLIESALTR